MSRVGKKFDVAANSSWVVARLRTSLMRSGVFNVVGHVAHRVALMERRVSRRSVHDRRVEDDRCMELTVNRSVLFRAFEWLVVVPVKAFRGGRISDFSKFFAQLDLPERVRLAGMWLITALISQTIAVSLAGVSIQTLGWGVRCGLVVIFLLFAFRPRAVAVAWSASWSGNRRSGLQSQSRNSD